MMRNLVVLGSTMLLAAAPSATGAEWRVVGAVPGEGVKVSVDDASLKVDHEYIAKGWVRFDYDKPRERYGQQLMGYASHRQVNCEENRFWVEESWGYPGAQAEPVRLYSAAQEWQMPAPGSEAEIASAALCYETKSIFSTFMQGRTIFSTLWDIWKLISSVVF